MLLLTTAGIGLAASPPRGGAVATSGLEGGLHDVDIRGEAADTEATVSREAWAMGTRVRIVVSGRKETSANGFAERILNEIEATERLLSTWRPDSELSRLNRAPVGVRTEVDPRVRPWLSDVRRLSAEAGGAFDPAIGALVDAWDLRADGRRPDAATLAAAVDASGAAAVEIDAGATTLLRRDPAAWIDAGAFGKGAALAAVSRLTPDASICGALVDLGGQIWARNDCRASATDGRAEAVRAAETVWVADPRERSAPVVKLTIRDASVATSGASERSVEIDGERLGHIVDPRSGQPVPAWGSATVVSRDPLEADALATALFVMGPDAGRSWAEARGIAALFLTTPDAQSQQSGLHITWTTHMKQWLQ